MGIWQKFGKTDFKQVSKHEKKTFAQKKAQSYRNRGYLARVTNYYVPTNGIRERGYAVWIRSK